MSFRLWRRIKIAPGITFNLSKSGGSLSFGRRGAHFTVGPRGRRATVGVPGTGLFYTTKLPGSAGGRSSSAAGTATVPPAQRLTLGFFKRLVTPDDEKALVDGCRELARNNEDGALEYLRRATHLADGAYLAGLLALKKGLVRDAAGFLTTAWKKADRLGRFFSKYDFAAVVCLPVTDEVSVLAAPDVRGVLLGLVEAYQHLGRREEALHCLEGLRKLEPHDPAVKLSLAELLLEKAAGEALTSTGAECLPNKNICRQVVRLAEGVENESEIHAALLLYKARALRWLGLSEAARDVLTVGLRRKKDRPAELLQALRYERALTYEELGKPRRARGDWEKLYAEAPDYEDVAKRLGLDD